MSTHTPIIGDVRIDEFIHPDSVCVTVWEVRQFSLATGKYAEEGQTYWKRHTPSIEPFTDRVAAEMFVKFLISSHQPTNGT